MINFIAIIQARSGSTRLPNKCLKSLHGISLVKRVYDNTLEFSPQAVVAIPKGDKALVDYLSKEHIPFYEGDENDVLLRYYDCATAYRAQNIGRITADCWCLDSLVCVSITQIFLQSRADFASNRIKPYTYPEGLDYECISYRCLQWLHKNAKDKKYREHVTNYIYENPKEFKLANMTTLNFKSKVNLSHLKLSIDTDEDWQQAEKLFVE
jgi:spore coat polysaccharide biosynthesis protein SpsF